jgi:hypothetical protein
MKPIFAAMLIAVLFVGCRKNNPVSADSASSSSNTAAFSAASMYKTAGDSTAAIDSSVCPHDSLRNVHMLDSLKVYLSLSDSQYVLLKAIGDTLFAQLKAIRTIVKNHQVSCDSSHVLVDAARTQFVASVTAILTTGQQTLFTTWLSLYWQKTGFDGGLHGGQGGRGCNGGKSAPSDSARNVAALDSLKTYLSLSDSQFVLLKAIDDTLTSQLKAIQVRIADRQVTLDSARVLIDNAQAQFVASVKAVLTADQIKLFTTWLTLYPEKPQGGGWGCPGGPGGHDGRFGGKH